MSDEPPISVELANQALSDLGGSVKCAKDPLPLRFNEPDMPPTQRAALIWALRSAQRAIHWHGWHDRSFVPDVDSMEARTARIVDHCLSVFDPPPMGEL